MVGVAFYRAGRLCLCKIDIYQASTEEVRAQIDLKWDYIIDSLTATGEKLEEVAHIDFNLMLSRPPETAFLTLRKELIFLKINLNQVVIWKKSMIILMIALVMACPSYRQHRPVTKNAGILPFGSGYGLWREIGPTGKNVTVKDVAIAAVMAGCKPKAMPVLIAAFKAMPMKSITCCSQ